MLYLHYLNPKSPLLTPSHTLIHPFSTPLLARSGVLVNDVYDELYASLCFSDNVCRACARGADGVHMDVMRLTRVVQLLLPRREQCIQEHLFL